MDGQVCAIGEIASKVINTICKRQSVDEKLQRLEMLVIKLRGTVEVSETLGAETVSLLQWRDKLKDAASKGNQVLLSFQRRAADGDMAAAEGSEEYQQGGGSSAVVLVRNILLAMDRGVRKAAIALLSYSECAASYTRSTLVGMARGVRSATTALLSCSEGVVKLNSTVDRLEKACADIGEFISLHHAEASSRAKLVCSPENRNRMTRGNEVVSTRIQESIIECGVVNGGNGKKDENKKKKKKKKNQQRGEPAPAVVMLKGSLEEPAAMMSTAARRLQDALAEISRAVAVADRQGLTNLEWLEELADVLQEDRRIGGEIIGIGRETMATKQEGVQQLRTSDAAGSKEEIEIEPGVNEKLQRLEMLVVKLRSTVEVSLRLGAEATSLLQWRDKLSEAASEGHLVLLNFKQRVMRVWAAATDATNEHKGGGKSGSTMFFVRKALLGMARGVQKSSTATTTLLLAGEGALQLNSTVGRLEKVCAKDVQDFIRLLQVETSQVEVMHMPMKRKKLELKTKLDRTENINVAENVILQDISVSREDGVRGRRRRFVLSSSSSGEEEDNYSSKNRRTRRRLIGLYSSSSSSIKQDEAEVGDEDGSRSRRSTGLLSSSSSSSKEGEREDSQSITTRMRLTGLFSSSSSSFSISSLSSSLSLPSLSKPSFSLSPSPLASSSSTTSEDGCLRRRARSYISTSPNDCIRRSFLVGEEELEEEEKEQAMLMAMARFEVVLAEINKAVEMAESRDLTSLEWLAEWAYILRDARQRGSTINLNRGEQEVEGICNAANILETLALDVECFISLVLLCPSIPATK